MHPRTGADPEPAPDLIEVARLAAEEARGVPTDLLEGYLLELARASTGAPQRQDGRLRWRATGARAAEQNVPMRGIIDLYLSATRLVWPVLPGVRAATGADALRRVGEAVIRAADTAITAVTDGYEEAQRWSWRQEESFRREFVDDLLEGNNVETLVGRAERYGLRLAGSYVVLAASGSEPFVDGGPATRQVASATGLDPLSRDILVTTKDGLLVCIVPDAGDMVRDFAARVREVLRPGTPWRIGIGRPQRGPGGAVRSFEQAKQALHIGQRLNLPDQLHWAADLLVYQVLSRDRAALADLVDAVLEPLRKARTGPGTLLETLTAYFAAGRMATAAARELHVGVRTVTYRLDRVEELTGYSTHDPQQSFTLQVAVLGAQLLDWPGGK
ncbi:PucR family transcriptional regulator [Streptomyces boninensis]|uniref:PucR family transcriptional regulator n=1 Tax=Streptomyces boninensis TaxID=2039455 RepID=UPI003B21A1EE